jgi:hypothetical protein
MVTGLGLFLWLLQAPAGSLAQAAPKESAALEAKLQTRVTDYQLVADDFVDALLKVAHEYKIPMGIVCVRTPPVMSGVKLSKKEASVQEIIQAIVKAQPGYTMTRKSGLVHIFGPGLVPDRENFLKLKVPEFEVHNQVVEIAERRLGDIVNATVSPPKPVPGGKAAGGIGHSEFVEVGDPDLNLKLRDVSVEEILDALTLASDRGVWIVTFAAAGELTPTGFRRMESPVSSEALPHPAKPLWELLKWGRKPY